jgi:hypothetical protein
MNSEDIINKIIPADDLHWCEAEKKYTSLSMEDLDSIILRCVSQNITDIDDIMKVTNWAVLVKVGDLLLKNFLDDKIKISGFDNNEEPMFGAKNNDDY